MKRHRHTPEQVVRKLREGERLLNKARTLPRCPHPRNQRGNLGSSGRASGSQRDEPAGWSASTAPTQRCVRAALFPKRRPR
jgi:hypothetical protein